MSNTNHQEGIADDIICRSRIYECLGCGFIGNEQKAENHQVECDNAMELIS